jgi:chemotaxis protein methyltransferase CheR
MVIRVGPENAPDATEALTNRACGEASPPAETMDTHLSADDSASLDPELDGPESVERVDGRKRSAFKDTFKDVEDLETQLLLDAILHRYGYDFRNYAPASLRRRVRMIVGQEGVLSISALQERLLREPTCMARFITNLSVPVTAMFRDPAFYRAVRSEIIPLLRTYPFVRIWHAGCSTGEEVYSLAILLTEEGLYERCRIYATDLSDATLERAQRGIYDLARMRDYTQNYQSFGGRQEFSSYYTADRGRVVFSPRLRKNVVFSQHNLVSDGPFNEFNLILCRNVMIYFDRTLRDRVLNLLDSSLCRFGVLGIGRKESLDFSSVAGRFSEFPSKMRLYRKEA